MRVLDISNIDGGNFSEIGYFDTYPSDDTAGFEGAWNVYPYFPIGNIIISDIDNGFCVISKK